MQFGNFAGGLAQGLNTGVNMQRAARQDENERRRLAIMEAGATQDQQVKQITLDKAGKEKAAYDELARLVEKYSTGSDPAAGGTVPAGATSEQRIGHGLQRNPGLMRNPEFLNAAAPIFIRAGMPEGVKWLEFAHNAAKENFNEMNQRLVSGDVQGALTAYNAGGQAKASTITPVMGSDGKPTGRYMVKMENGSETEIDPVAAFRATMSPSDFFKAMREEQELDAKKALWKAQEGYFAGRNQTAQNVADTRADASTANTILRAGTGGGTRAGGGKGAGTTGQGRAKWMEDFEKVLPTRDVLGTDGKPVTYMKAGNIETKQEVDNTIAPALRDLARLNSDALEFSGVAPQEAAATFSGIAAAFRDKKPPEIYDQLQSGNGLVFGRDSAGNAKKVAVRIGTAQDGTPILAVLTDAQQKALLAEDKRRQLAEPKQQQSYRQEDERLLKRAPAAAAASAPAPKGREAAGKIRRPAAASGINLK